MPYSRVAVSTPSVPEQIRDEGSDLPLRTVMDFVGAGVTASDTAGRTLVTIPGVSAPYTATTDTAAGATQIVLNQAVDASVTTQTWLLIDAYTSQAELRKATAVSGATITVSALSYAHNIGDIVRVIHDGEVTADMWSCKGDGTTDDHDALQEAERQASTSALWLDYQGRTYAISSPLMMAQSHQTRNGTVKALASFAPAESNNAAIMGYNGSVRTFTADPATNVITTSLAHSLPSDGTRVVFQGSNLPGGLTAGKVYYAYNRTTLTFTVSATLGGSDVDITAANAGGTVFCEVYGANMKTNFSFFTLDGNNVTSLNGMLFSVQQQTQWDKLRVNNCPEYGILVRGQQADWRNIEIINCGDSLGFDDMSFLYVKDLNCEQFSRSAIKSVSGLTSSHIIGFHCESRDTAGVFCDFTASFATNCVFEDISMSGFNTDTSDWVGFDFNNSANSYTIRNLRFPQGTPSASSAIAVRDTYRGQTAYVWADSSGASSNRVISELIAGNIPSSAIYTEEYGGTTWWGMAGKRVQIGTQRDGQPTIVLYPGSSQTADQIIVKDTSGATTFQVSKDGLMQLGGASKILSGSGAPGAGVGSNGDYYFRVDTPGTGNQRLYVKAAGVWTGIL